jgi:hypothetical protein
VRRNDTPAGVPADTAGKVPALRVGMPLRVGR